MSESKDLQARIELFNGELKESLGKYNLALGAEAFLTPDGRIASRPTLIDGNAIKKAQEEKESKKIQEG